MYERTEGTEARTTRKICIYINVEIYGASLNDSLNIFFVQTENLNQYNNLDMLWVPMHALSTNCDVRFEPSPGPKAQFIFIYLSIYVFMSIFFSKSIYPSIYLSENYPSIYFIYLSMNISIFIYKYEFYELIVKYAPPVRHASPFKKL